MAAPDSKTLAPPVAQAFRLGVEHHRAGRLDQAERAYQKVLRRAPDHADTLHLLGVIATERGRPARAIQLIGQALRHLPNFADAHLNLANAHRACGQADEAIQSYRRAIALNPALANAHSNLARVLNDAGRYADALASAQRAAAVAPGLAEAHVNSAVSWIGLQNFPEAEQAYRRALALQPDRAVINRGLALVLKELDRFDEAIAFHEKAVALNPGDALSHAALGRTLFRARKLPEAEASFRRALALAPGHAQAHTGLGMGLAASGQFDEAAACFRRALRADPGEAEAHRGLAAIGRAADEGDHGAEAGDGLAALLARPGLPETERVAACFAMGTRLDQQGQFDAAFAHFRAGNELLRARLDAGGRGFDAAALARDVDALIAGATPEFFAGVAGQGSDAEAPVFVVGMPRSGTSLIEQIAASHSEIFGAGELKLVSALAEGLRREIGAGGIWVRDAARVRILAEAHLAALRGLGGGAARIIDKMPDNIFHLGMIAAVFPRARIIFAARDPRDTCLSCYFQRFAELNAFSYDLAACGRRAVQVARLTAHWRRVLPLRMLTVEYEALVAEPERESRRLIEFLGLAWEPGCLRFHETNRPVLTASNWQVRQPVYARSVGRWLAYEPHIGALIAALAGQEENASF